MTLRELFIYSKNAAALAAALTSLAVLGLGLEGFVGFAVTYALTRGLMEYWARDIPPPLLTFLYVLALLGLIGGTQFIVLVSVIIAAFLIKEVKLGRPSLGALKMAFVGAVMPVIMLVVPIYEAFKVRKSPILALTFLASALVFLFGLLTLAVYNSLDLSQPLINAVAQPAVNFTAAIPGLSQYNPFTWLGIIAYEELIGRVTQWANGWFVLLHLPSRIVAVAKLVGPLYGVFGAVFVLAVIHFTTRWLWDLYKKGGILNSIAGHALYNAAVSSFLTPYWAVWLAVGVIGFMAINAFKADND